MVEEEEGEGVGEGSDDDAHGRRGAEGREWRGSKGKRLFMCAWRGVALDAALPLVHSLVRVLSANCC